jgi:hypothetical protein
MRGTYADAVAGLKIADAVTFASLPLSLLRLVFLALPADARGRASCVSRGWRDTLAEPSLWTCLDMSLVHVEEQRFHAILHGAVACGRGQLQQLDLSQHRVTWGVLLPVLTANAGSLRKLHLRTAYASDAHAAWDNFRGSATIRAVVVVAPLLRVLLAEDLSCTWEDAPLVLRAEPPFAPLQMRGSLDVNFSPERYPAGGLERVRPFAVALADAVLQPSLLRLSVWSADTAQPAVMIALVDAALARRLRELKLVCCTPPAAAPLARLLAEGSLAALAIHPSGDGEPVFDAAGAVLVANALRMNTTLTTLVLFNARLCSNMRVAGVLLGALVGHRSLRELRITSEVVAVEYRSAFGAALAALIAADTPALQTFDCFGNQLGDAGLAPIVEALAFNRHLLESNVGNNGMSDAFAREWLLPALRRNTSLRTLKCDGRYTGPAAVEAEELVRRRGQRG